MRHLLIFLSINGLILTLLPSLLVYHEVITLDTYKTLTLVGTVLWLTTAPWWMNKKKPTNASEQH